MKRQNKQSSSAFISTVRKVDYKLDPHNNPEVKKDKLPWNKKEKNTQKVESNRNDIKKS